MDTGAGMDGERGAAGERLRVCTALTHFFPLIAMLSPLPNEKSANMQVAVTQKRKYILILSPSSYFVTPS